MLLLRPTGSRTGLSCYAGQGPRLITDSRSSITKVTSDSDPTGAGNSQRFLTRKRAWKCKTSRRSCLRQDSWDLQHCETRIMGRRRRSGHDIDGFLLILPFSAFLFDFDTYSTPAHPSLHIPLVHINAPLFFMFLCCPLFSPLFVRYLTACTALRCFRTCVHQFE